MDSKNFLLIFCWSVKSTGFIIFLLHLFEYFDCNPEASKDSYWRSLQVHLFRPTSSASAWHEKQQVNQPCYVEGIMYWTCIGEEDGLYTSPSGRITPHQVRHNERFCLWKTWRQLFSFQRHHSDQYVHSEMSSEKMSIRSLGQLFTKTCSVVVPTWTNMFVSLRSLWLSADIFFENVRRKLRRFWYSDVVLFPHWDGGQSFLFPFFSCRRKQTIRAQDKD